MNKQRLIVNIALKLSVVLIAIFQPLKAVQYSEPEKAFKDAIKQYRIGLENNNRYKIASAQLEIGTFYYFQGEYNTAESYCWKAGINFQVIRMPKGLIKSLIVLGDVMRKEKNFEKAMEFYIAAKYLSINKAEKSDISRIYNKIGDVFRHKKIYKKAEFYYEKSIELNKISHSMVDLANDYANIGEVYRMQGRIDFANVYYQQGMDIAKIYNLPFNMAENGHGLACIDTLKKNYDAALERITYIQKIAEKNKFREELKNIYHLKAAIYEAQHKYFESMMIQKEYNALIDRLYATSTVQNSVQQNELFNLDLKNEELKKKNQTIRQLSLLQSWLFVALILLLIAVIYFFYISKIRKKEHQNLKIQSDLLRKANDALTEQEIELNQSNETRNKMLGMITHDVRSPLYDCLRLMELMLGKSNNAIDLKKTGIQVISSLRGSTQLIDNLMFWSRTNANNLSAQLEIIDIASTLENEISLLEIMAESKLIKLSISIPENTMVYADANMLRMIVRNLIMNAMKYTPKDGEIKLIAKRINGHTEIRVIDNGKGIDSEQITHLFDYKNKKSIQGLSGENGSGLGLVLVKEFVEKNKGFITVKSTPNEGSEFRFTLNSI